MAHADNDGSELLLVIVDADREAWSVLDAAAAELDALSSGATASGGSKAATAAASSFTSFSTPRRASFPEFLTALELFLAAFCVSSRKNGLAVFGYNGFDGGYLYPPPGKAAASTVDPLRAAVVKRQVHEGLVSLRYETDETVEAAAAAAGDGEEVAAAAARHHPHHGVASSSSSTSTFSSLFPSTSRLGTLGSCLSSALCYAHTLRKSDPKLRARVIIFQASADVSAQYIPVINAVCSAQRFGIPIDSVVLGPHQSVFLQQAASLTHAQHLKPDVSAGHHTGLFQYLSTLLLPDARTRVDVLMPPQHDVNLRAHCFCHKQHKTSAWLCYVCLSIWCKPLSTCPTCGTETSGAAAAAGTPGIAAGGGGSGAMGGRGGGGADAVATGGGV